MEDDLLGSGLLHLKSGGRLHLRDGVLAGIQAVAQLVETDLAALIGGDLPEVKGLRRAFGLADGCVGHMEPRPLHRSPCYAVYLINREFRGLMVLEIHIAVPIRLEGDQLAGGVQQVGLRDTLLNDLIDDGQKILNGHSAVRPGGHLGDGAAVRRLYGENGALHRLARVGVTFVDRQTGPLVVGQAQLRGPAGGQLHMVLRGVQNVVRQGSSLCDGINTGLQIRDQNFAILISGAVQITAAILDASNTERDPLHWGTVRTGFDQPQTGLLGVGKYELCGIVGPEVDDPLGIVDYISLALQLRHHIGAFGQAAQVDLAIGIGGELLRAVAPIHRTNFKHRAGDGLAGIGTVHLYQLHPGFHVIEENQIFHTFTGGDLNFLIAAV